MSTRLEFRSVLGNKVSLSKDALNHILGRHGELEAMHDLVNEIGKTIEQPDFVIPGFYGEHLAIRRYRGRYLVVPYEEDGEVRTAFITSKVAKLLRRQILWKR